MHVSRRELMQAGLAIGVGAALPAMPQARAADQDLITKAIPATGEKIPVIGIGTNEFGTADYNNVVEILRRMHALGGTVIDTAAAYGQSEVVIGKALAQLGITRQMFIATKFNDAKDASGRPPPGSKGALEEPYDPTNGMDSVQRSLQRLGRIDLLFVHHIDSVEPLMPILLDLKRQRRVRYIGFTSVGARVPADAARTLEYLRRYPFDFLQVDYSLGNRRAEAQIFPLAQQRGTAIMVAEPLSGSSSSVERFSLFGQTRGRKIPGWAAELGIASWGQLFLKYAVSHPAVTCAIPGTTKIANLEDNQAAGHGRLLTAAERGKIERFWQDIA